MRTRVRGLVAAAAMLASVASGTVPSAAAPAGWTVEPGGPAAGDADSILLYHRPASGGADGVMDCLSTGVELTLFSSVTSHIGNVEDMTFGDCLMAGLYTFDLNAQLPWRLHATSYSAPLVSVELRDVSIQVVFPGCWATLQGYLRGAYDNSTGALTLIPDYTLEFIHVDPVDNCFGLFRQGDLMGFEAVYHLGAGQEIVPA